MRAPTPHARAGRLARDAPGLLRRLGGKLVLERRPVAEPRPGGSEQRRWHEHAPRLVLHLALDDAVRQRGGRLCAQHAQDLVKPQPVDILHRRKLSIAEQTCAWKATGWKRKFGGMGVAELRRLKQLEEQTVNSKASSPT